MPRSPTRGAQVFVLCCLFACEKASVQRPSLDPPTEPPVRSDPAQTEPDPTTVDPPRGEVTSVQTSHGRSVLWKRYAALEADLMRGLELGRDEVCMELGTQTCIRDVHLVALGGSDSFRSGLHRPPNAPLNTTPLAVDRVVLSACSARARADREGPARVFTGIDLGGPAPAPGDPSVSQLVANLSRRLLARDATERDQAVLSTLLTHEQGEPPQTGEEFAVLACFAIATSLEFLFY